MKKNSKSFILLITIVGLLGGLVPSLEARRSDKKETNKSYNNHPRGRGARAAGFVGGATAAGLGVGLTKGAGWGVLGAVGGGLAGYFLVRAIQKGRENKKNSNRNNNRDKEN